MTIRNAFYSIKRKARKQLLRERDRIALEREFAKSAGVETDASKVKTISVMLGPYRNLTSLTAAVLFLHPNTQALNHAMARIAPLPRVNFFHRPTEKTLDNFIRYSIFLSQKGDKEEGDHGGTLTVSHAFTEHQVVQEVYEDRFGGEKIKREILSLVWKESMRVSNYVQQEAIDLLELCDQLPRLRFLMPIRNPMDCAISNTKTGHALHLLDKDQRGVTAILDRIIREIAWFKRLERLRPDRFFSYYQDEFDRERIVQLAEFLMIPAGETWVSDAERCYVLKPSYPHDAALVEAYRRNLEAHLADLPDVHAALLRFIPTDQTNAEP